MNKAQTAQRKPSSQTTTTPRVNGPNRGFSLLEAVVAMGLIAGVGLLVGMAFSFSLLSEREARAEMEAARSAGQILEILRGTSYDSLDLVEDGSLTVNPLGRFQQLILSDLEDRLSEEGLSVYLTVRNHQARSEAKQVFITIVSSDTDPHISLKELPPGKVLVKQSTIMTRKGINP
ncbi:MAG: hypothetical protein GHCLOJNM_02771 [bacterium]|nr:hypothetical protein [bacterium]